MKFTYILIISIMIFIVNGCGEIDNKEVSKENFINILNDYYSRNCVMIGTGDFPKEEKLKGGFYNSIKELEALERLGFVKSKNIKIEEVWIRNETKKVDGKLFSLTEKGKKYYKNEKYSKGFCIYNRSIATIDNYTEPSNMMGMTLTRVNFTFSPIKSTDLLREIKKEKVLMDSLSKSLNKKSDRAELILTGMKGWMHQRDFKRLK